MKIQISDYLSLLFTMRYSYTIKFVFTIFIRREEKGKKCKKKKTIEDAFLPVSNSGCGRITKIIYIFVLSAATNDLIFLLK